MTPLLKHWNSIWNDYFPPINLYNFPNKDKMENNDNIAEDKCIEYQGCKDESGYGLRNIKGVCYRTHRLAWEEVNGTIPKGLFVCHKCDNPSCININHLFLGTNSDNMLDMYKKGRGNNYFKYNNPKRKLTEEQVIDIKIRLENKETQQSIADIYKVDRTLISAIKTEKIWTSVKKPFQTS